MAHRRISPSIALPLLATALVAEGATSAAAASATSTPVVRTPLPTSITTSAGTWASVPMGHLNQPLNTFWQLFLLRKGSWKNDVGVLGIATNGGIGLASAFPSELLVGIGPTDLLHYSAVLRFGDRPQDATPELPLSGRLESLAMADDGEAAAVTGDRAGGTLFERAHPGSPWRRVERAAALRGVAKACDPSTLTSAGFDAGGTLYLGAACAHAGAVGLYALERNHWRLVPVPKAGRVGTTAVLGVLRSRSHTVALVEEADGARSTLLAVSLAGAKAATAAVCSLPSGARVTSVGPDGDGGAFVLIVSPGGQEHLATVSAQHKWSGWTAVPARTATVAYSAGRIDALAVDDTVMTDWVRASSGSWDKRQVLHVDIEFGSS